MVLLILLALALAATHLEAFQTGRSVPSIQRNTPSIHKPTHTVLTATEQEEAYARNQAGTDVRNLLTQRSIQSFMFLCSECRDPHSGKWIEDFLETKNQLQYHGTKAGYISRFGGTWDAPLLKLMEQPKDVVIVSAKRRGRGHGGWSKENPYLEVRYVEFEIDIDPVSLTSRILSVREQIAREWVNDLDILGNANKNILESYYDQARTDRDDTDSEDDNGGSDNNVNDANRMAAFVRTSMSVLNDVTEAMTDASSPFRKGNFDLLHNLCTQESIHRLLRVLMNGDGEKNRLTYTYLRDFYIERVEEFFDGDQTYGRADDFMEELLLSAPSVTAKGLTDPLGLAEQIIQTRANVITEWKVLMEQVPNDHTMGIRKSLLSKQMESWGSGGIQQADSTKGGFD